MATGIIYLDVDDEITSAAARIRRAETSRVAVVLPYGSKVATSRINFRLLARDALTHEKRLSIVAPDGATRALAASAGLPVFATVAEYEGAFEDGDGDGSAPAGGAASAAAAGLGVDDATIAMPVPAPADGATDGAPAEAVTPAAPPVPPAPKPVREVRPAPAPAARAEADAAPGPATSIPIIGGFSRRSIPRTPVLIAVAVVALALLVGGVGAYVLLPSATVVVTPHERLVGPRSFSVVADTTATEPDPGSGVIPAELVSIDVTAEDTFESTGTRVEQTRATGRVTFQNLDPGGANTIRAGSVVSTEGGVEFQTLRSVTLPAAEIVTGTPIVVIPTTARVDVEAVRNGPNGNVPANSITVVPSGENPTLTKVRNEAATRGGSRTEFPVVEQADVDAALAALGEQLTQSFDERLADPSIAPPEMTVFLETAVLGEPAPTTDPAELVGTEVETFDLAVAATGTVIAVDPSPVEAIAETRLAALVSPGSEIVDGSITIRPGSPLVEGQQISFPVTVEARQVSIPDAAELERLILGKSEAEARELLAPFGDVELTLWPDWVSSVPTIDGRVEVEVRPPLPVASTPTPTASPAPTPAPSPSDVPSAGTSSSPAAESPAP
ncbi:MAG TPA: baseplate J/gp47 family protein [Clostridia bacterium]|nr:baseplate J/gp47 family protein [Clostridia bacterium]